MVVHTRYSQTPRNSEEDSTIQTSESFSKLDSECLNLLTKLTDILAKKAPEGIPILNELVSKVSTFSNVNEEKKRRSNVIYGVKEADSCLPASERPKCTEREVEGILNALDVETRPVEAFRIGKEQNSRRLIKAVFSSRKIFFDVLKKAPNLRNDSRFTGIYLRRSMTLEERIKDKELRKQAKDLNEKEGKGHKIYVVYKQQVIKTADIESNRRSKLSKN